MAEPAEPVDDVRERPQEPEPVGVVAVDRGARVPARDDVVDASRDADPQRPSHTPRLGKRVSRAGVRAEVTLPARRQGECVAMQDLTPGRGRRGSATRAGEQLAGGDGERRVQELHRVERRSGRPARRSSALTWTRQPDWRPRRRLARRRGRVRPCAAPARSRPAVARGCRSPRCRSKAPDPPARRGRAPDAREHGPLLRSHALRVSEMAGVLERDSERERLRLHARLEPGEELGDVARTRREGDRPLTVEGVVGKQMRVVLQIRAATGGIGDDEIDARFLEHVDRPAGILETLVVPPGASPGRRSRPGLEGRRPRTRTRRGRGPWRRSRRRRGHAGRSRSAGPRGRSARRQAS